MKFHILFQPPPPFVFNFKLIYFKQSNSNNQKGFLKNPCDNLKFQGVLERRMTTKHTHVAVVPPSFLHALTCKRKQENALLFLLNA